MGNEPKLSGTNIYKSFIVRGKNITVLKGINFSIFPGEMVVVKGRSGQGKTVLLWLLSGIDMPTSGEVCFEGIPYQLIDRGKLAKLRQEKIGMIFQDFNLVPSWTALENVESAMLHCGKPRSARRHKAATLLERMELGNRLDNLPAELSVGQQQRVALARALINEPSLILADEPTGSVDEETGKELLAFLVSFVKEQNAAMVVATHGNFNGEDAADRVLWLNDGKLSESRGK